MKKRACIAVLIIIVVFQLGGCKGKEKPLPTLRVGHAPHDHHSPLYVAAMNPEYFKEHGGIYLKEIVFRHDYDLMEDARTIAHVHIESSTGGKEIIRKLAEHHFDMSFGGFPAMLSCIDQGSAMHIVAPVMAEGAGLVVDKDLPIENWDEFLGYVRKSKKPVRIGYKIGTSVQNLIFERALQEAGVSYSNKLEDSSAKIILVNMYGANNLIPALKNELIDGFVIMQPFMALAEESGEGRIVTLLNELPLCDKCRGYPCCALAVNDAYVQNHAEIVEAMVVLMLRGNRFIEENPEISALQIAHWLDIPADIEKQSIPTIKFTTEYNEEWKQGMEFWVKNMMEEGKVQGRVKQAYEAGELEKLIYERELYNKARSKM